MDKYDVAARARQCRSCRAAAGSPCRDSYAKKDLKEFHAARRSDAIVEATGMKAGVYRLAADVTNPKPDRRERHDWRKFATWSTGLVVYVFDGEYGLELSTGQWRSNCFLLGSAPTVLVDAMQASAPATVTEALRAGNYGEHMAIYALQHLVDDGVLTLEQIVAAAETRASDPE